MAAAQQRKRIEDAVREILLALGEDPARGELQATPARVAASYLELCSGVGKDPIAILRENVFAEDKAGQLIAVRDLQLQSLCAHHLLPFSGKVHIAYVPTGMIAGFGALPKALKVLAQRPQMQERLGQQLAEAITEALHAAGALVIIEARHACLSDRGANEQEAAAVTVAATGDLSGHEVRSATINLLLQNASKQIIEDKNAP